MALELEEAAEITHDFIKEDLMQDVDTERSGWVDLVALSTMIMALLSALGALLAGVSANELLIERTEEILKASQMETDRINIELLKSKHTILLALGSAVDNSEVEKIHKYQVQNQRLNVVTEVEESGVQTTLFNHEFFAIAVTLLSIAITLSGMSLVTKRHQIWAIGLAFGLVGSSFLGIGVYNMIVY